MIHRRQDKDKLFFERVLKRVPAIAGGVKILSALNRIWGLWRDYHSALVLRPMTEQNVNSTYDLNYKRTRTHVFLRLLGCFFTLKLGATCFCLLDNLGKNIRLPHS